MLRRFFKDRRGATAVEFALLAGPFLLILMASVELGIKSFIQSDLDRVLSEVTSNLSMNDRDVETSESYINQRICAIAGPLINCGEIEVGSAVVTGRLFDYRNQSLSGRWNVGCGGDVILIELTFKYFDIMFPFAVADIVTVNGEKRYRSRVVVRREPILSGSRCT